MRHRQTKAILNRPADQRKALIRNLVTSLFLHGSVQTTDAKAKALVSAAEKLIAKAKSQKEVFNTIRELKKTIYTKDASTKALSYIQNTKRTSGFTRQTKIRLRRGDNALIVQVDLLEEAEDKKQEKEKKAPKKAPPTSSAKSAQK